MPGVGRWASQSRGSTRIRVQAISIQLTAPPEYPICLKILLSNQIHQRMKLIPIDCPLQWDDVQPIDAKPTDNIELRIYEYHTFGRKVRIGAVAFQAHDIGRSSMELVVTDNTGLVPSSVKFTFSPQSVTSAAYSIHQSAAAAMIANRSALESMGRARNVASTILRIGQRVSEVNVIAEATLGLCNLAWQTLEKQDICDKLIVDLLSGMGNILPLIEAVESQAEVEQLKLTIVEVLRLVEDASRFVVDYQSNGAAVRTIRAFVSSTAQEQVDEFLERFKRLKEEFDTGVGIQIALEVKAVLKDADQDILKRQITPDAGYNPMDGCLEGTRTKVLADIQEWVDDNSPSQSLYWISGLAGSGKTTIAHSVCALLRECGYLAASFFCKRDSEQLSKPENILSGVAIGLAFKYQPFGIQLVTALRKEPLVASSALAIRFRYMIADPIKSVPLDAPTHRLFVVIDALDECGSSRTRGQLVTYLIELAKLMPWVRFVLTSRRNHELERLLKTDQVLHRDLSNDYQASVGGDIGLLVRHRLKDLIEDDETLNQEPWLEDGTVFRLTTRANGLFIWAQTACNIICNSLNPGRKIHELTSDEPSRDATSQLHSLYSRILREALGETLGGAEAIKSCIAVIVTARIPLADTDMSKLLDGRVEFMELQRVVRQLSSVVYRDTSGVVRVSHQSFKDYMLTEQCPIIYRTDRNYQNIAIAASCLRIMVRGLRFNICRLEDSRLYNHEVTDLQCRIREQIPTHLDYSCVYWIDHLSAAETFENPCEEHQLVVALLSQLLKGPLALYWIEVMSLLGKLHECEWALMRIKDWIPHDNHELLNRAEELQRLVTDFYLPISQSTPHLYISALAIGSEAWNQFRDMSDQFPNRVELVQGKHLARLSNRWSRPMPHPSQVSAVTYSPTGKLIVTACYDGHVRIFNALTGALLFRLPHNSPVNSVSVAPDSQHIVSGSDDNKLRVWDTDTGTLVFDPLVGHTSAVTCVVFSPDGRRIMSGSKDRTVRIWDMHANVGVVLVLDHPNPLRSLAICPDGSQLVSGSQDNVVRIWNMIGDTSNSPTLLRGHDGGVKSVIFSSDGQYVASGSYDMTVRIWDISSGTSIRTLSHSGIVISIAFSPDSRYVASGSWDGAVRVYDMHTGAAAFGPLLGHSGWVNSVAFSPDGQRIASGSYDRKVLLWDARMQADVPSPLQGHNFAVDAVGYSPDGQRIATGSGDRTVRVWDAHTGAPAFEPISSHSDTVTSIEFSPDGHRVVSASRDKTVWLWNAHTGSAVLGPFRHSSPVAAVTFSSDGRRIIAADKYAVRVWDSENGSALHDIHEGHPSHAASKVFSPDDQRILSIFLRQDSSVILVTWDAHTGAHIQTFEKRNIEKLWSVSLSPDGCYLAVGTLRGHIHVWNTRTDTLLFDVGDACIDSILSIAFSPDSRRLASLSGRGMLQLWDVHNGEAVATPAKFQGSSPTTIVFSPDGRRIVSGHWDGEVHVWDVSGQSAPRSELPDNFPRSSLLPARVASNQLAKLSNIEGWVQDGDGKPVLWLPHVYRQSHVVDSLFAISKKPSDHPISFDFSRFRYGEEWASIHVPNSFDS